MTLPSQTPRSSSPLSTSARQAQGTRTLFIAVAALGLGGAVAGWLITHRSETPEQAAEATIVDPLVAADTGAPAEAMAASVERQARHQHHPDRGRRRGRMVAGDRHAPGIRLAGAEVPPVACDHVTRNGDRLQRCGGGNPPADAKAPGSGDRGR